MSPIGYVNEKGKGIVPHPELSILVKKTFEAYSTGNFTLREVRDKFNALGLKRKSGRELAEVVDVHRELMDVLRLFADEIERQADGLPRPDGRQVRELVSDVLDRFG